MKTYGTWRSRHETLANLLALAAAVALVAWPAYGVMQDDFAVPAGYLDGDDFHFHGAAAWLLAAGFICQAASILVIVSRRLRASTDVQADRQPALGLAVVGLCIIFGMTTLKLIGLM